MNETASLTNNLFTTLPSEERQEIQKVWAESSIVFEQIPKLKKGNICITTNSNFKKKKPKQVLHFIWAAWKYFRE